MTARLLPLALLLAAAAAQAKPAHEAERLLALGDSLLAAGDAEGAEAAYAAVPAGLTSGALAHNRGLAALRAGRVGEAVLHLLRARRLLPGDPSVAQSLAAARARAGIAAMPEGAGWRFVRAFARPAGVSGLLALAAMLGLAAVFLAARRRRRPALGLGGAAVLAWALALAAWADAAPRAVVIAPSALHAAPADSASVRATLAPGRTLRLGPSHGAWQAARVPGGPRGWVPARTVGEV